MAGPSNIFRDPEYRFHEAVLLERVVPRRVRLLLSGASATIILVFLLVATALYAAGMIARGVVAPPGLPSDEAGMLAVDLPIWVSSRVADIDRPESVEPTSIFGAVKGALDTKIPTLNSLFLLAIAIHLAMRMLEWRWRSQYYLVESLLERGLVGAKTPYSTPCYEVCDLYYDVRGGDLTRAFLESPYGRRILLRVGLQRVELEQFLGRRTNPPDYGGPALFPEVRKTFTLLQLVEMLTHTDEEFYQFLFQRGIRKGDLAGAAEWVERDIKKQKQQDRAWGRVKLGQAPTVGAEFAYGAAYLLSRFSVDLSQRAISGGSNFRFVYGNNEIGEIEVVLSRAKEANALLVGEEGAGVMDVILDFARDIMNGHTNPALVHKRVMAFDAKSFLATMKTKQEAESSLIRVMNDAVKAGNIILVIEDLPGFLQSASAIDADVWGVLDPYLAGADIQVIATADHARFHRFIEMNSAIMSRFEKVVLSEPAEDALVRIVEEVAESSERRNPVIFSYPAVVSIVKSAQQFFTDAIMPDKAIDIVVELVPTALAHGERIITKEIVESFIHEKTKIPIGNIGAEERERLLHLETLLKQQVVGQERALDLVAGAMRRSRAGVRSMERPIGSFLFLGPTGVGKTETAKALASVFFGDPNAMSRIDMSEYQGEDGLNRLIGTMEGEVGTLPVMLKEQPYGVILLDEFEKANVKVLDLFLQVLDEGVFHDAQGKKVNARNVIFIATSNAGAKEIREAIRSGKDLEVAQKEIVDMIIAQGKYRPELLNRFDGVVLFHPLTEAHYRVIAKFMLEKLRKRLREKSIDLVVNDVLINALMAHGIDPDFGARPMNRAVQEVIEQKVAEKIIAGQLALGSTLAFTEADFPELESPVGRGHEEGARTTTPSRSPTGDEPGTSGETTLSPSAGLGEAISDPALATASTSAIPLAPTSDTK
jgi:ATP-dependent Clp protease ATP-binding subunit ClpA